MTFSNEAIGGGADGGIFNFYSEFPIWMSHDDVSVAMVEIDASVRGIQEPPVASVFNDNPSPDGTPIDDYRRFYIEFTEDATANDICSAVNIVGEALKKIRYAAQ